ncbi:MAG: N-6 DNA methylase, partial [Saprospiraceae bacterium]
MAKFIIDISNSHPELKDAWKLFEELVYRRAYSQVFSDLIERMLSRQTAKFENGQFISVSFTPSDYSKGELTILDNIIILLENEYKKRVWFRKEKGDRRPSGWYDPLGSLYEVCSSRSQKSAMGQFFTPRPIIDFMVQINLGDLGDKKFVTMAEPACGSGRFGLAAGTYIGSKGIPSYICQNELKKIRKKMTAINMTYNGIVGEITCSNGLDIEGNTFRFGYKICPILSFFEPEYWNSIRFQMYRTTRKWAEFQYVAIPVTYEQTYISKVNARTL